MRKRTSGGCRQSGFTLVALMVMLAVAAIIFTSQEYIGRATRDSQIERTDRIVRDLASFSEAIRQRYILHMHYRSLLLSGAGGVEAKTVVSELWEEEAIQSMLSTFPGIDTINTWGAGKDLAMQPVITCSVLRSETLTTGDVIPSTISITITVTTNMPMYAEAAKNAQGKFMKSNYITGMEFDFTTKKSFQVGLLIGQQSGSSFGPVM